VDPVVVQFLSDSLVYAADKRKRWLWHGLTCEATLVH